MKLALVAVPLFALGFTATALAVPPTVTPPEKSSILHCGCAEDGLSMVYTEISVSAKSRGHDAHVATSRDSCFDGVETYTDFIRTGSDCQLSGPQLGDPIDACGLQLAGDVCGAEEIIGE